MQCYKSISVSFFQILLILRCVLRCTQFGCHFSSYYYLLLSTSILNDTYMHTYIHTYIYTYVHTYGIAQFKLDRTHVQHGLNTTCFSFHMGASMHVHARLMMSNLPCIALVYTLDMCTTVCRYMCVCQESTCQIWITCACKL